MNHQTSIQPWLTINRGEEAINFYKSAFNATETFRMQDPGGGLVVRLSINGAEFWISSESASQTTASPLATNNIRMILVVDNPKAVFNKAIAAGASEIFPVREEFGWLAGKLSDPFGLHWEIGHELKR